MKIDELWMIHYKDDVTFSEKLKKFEDLQLRYKIHSADAAQALLTDCGIQCGSKDDLIADKDREVGGYLKIPYSTYSKKPNKYTAAY